MSNRFWIIAAVAAAAACGSSSPTASSLDLSSPVDPAPVAGSTVSITVVAKANGAPAGGVHVGFSVTAGGGTMLDANASTGADGKATARWTLGTLAGPQMVVATADGAPALSITTTAVAGPAAKITLTASSGSVRIGENLPLAVRIVDANGNAVAAAPSFTTTAPDVASVSTDGVVTGISQGSVTVQATVTPASGSVSLSVSGLLSHQGTATIDGVLSPGEWDLATSTPVAINVEGGTTPGQLLVMNDGVNLYVAVAFLRASADFGSSVALEFDKDRSGNVSDGDDFIVLTPGVGFSDGVRSTAPPCSPGALCAPADTDVGGTNDGAGAFHNDGRMSVYELSHPLNSGDVHDVALQSASTIGMNVFLRLQPTNTAPLFDTNFPAVLNSSPASYLQVTIH
jgi:hypothetical protein